MDYEYPKGTFPTDDSDQRGCVNYYQQRAPHLRRRGLPGHGPLTAAAAELRNGTSRLIAHERPALLRTLNEAIGDEDRDFKIGPSYLMRPEADSQSGLQRIWQYDLLPLLEEREARALPRPSTPSMTSCSTGLACQLRCWQN